MKTKILDIISAMMAEIENANHKFNGGGLNSDAFTQLVKTRVNAQSYAAEKIEALYVAQLQAIAEKAEEMQSKLPPIAERDNWPKIL